MDTLKSALALLLLLAGTQTQVSQGQHQIVDTAPGQQQENLV